MPADWRALELHDVVFRHARARHADRPAVSVERLTLHRGEKVALIGPSGAGKSTLMRELAGLYEADEGRALVDGAPLPGLRALSRTATFVPQDTEVFEASVRDNLTFGVDHPMDRIERATRTAALDPVLAALPQGLDTVIVERGANLSGGQKQRLALARGLLAASNGTLVMLDEPTSALDTVTETQVFERLHDDFPEATVIASVHRMSALGHFDRVVLMQAGRVVDVGTVDELRARSELFRRMQRGAEQAAAASERAAAGSERRHVAA
jgi:ABC-type multidrug transport system fused ATPase/permease subunit